jgi:hypothetical protein
MEKNILSEEIKRMVLLSKYDNRKTLTENADLVNEMIVEGIGQALADLFKADSGLARAAAKDIESGILSIKGGVTDVKGVALTDGKSVMNAVKTGTLGAVELGKVNAMLFSKTASDQVRRAIISDLMGSKSLVTKFSKLTEKEAIANLKATGKYTDSEITHAMKEYKAKGNTFKGKSGATPNTSKPTTKNPKVKKPKVKKQKPAPIPNKPTNWQQFKDKIRGLSRSKIVKYLVAAGGIYLLYRWLTSKGTTPFPICLTTNMSTEDYQRMHDEGVDDIFIGETGNSTIDMNGGGRFSDNGTFKTANGKYSGDWSEENGGIAITIGGQSYNMACGVVDPEVRCPEGQSWDGEKCVPVGPNPNPRPWVNCTTFPYKRGCKNNDLVEIQKCLGISSDGKFGKDTERALKNKGYDTIITKELYDKIMANCGNTTTTTTIFTPERNEFGNDDLI